jgi:hypothetical protein
MTRVSRFGLACAIGTIVVLSVSACGGGPGPGCFYSLSLDGRGVPATGGNVQVQVEAPAGCTWAFQGNDPWISVAGAPAPATSGSGNGAVVVTAAANAGGRRAGTATVGFQRVTIDQAGTDGAGSCTFQIFPLPANIGPAGGLGAFAVVPNAPDCSWWVEARTPDDDWIDGDFHQDIGVGVSPYQVAPSTVLPSLPLPRTGRLGLRNSANALITDHLITQTP